VLALHADPTIAAQLHRNRLAHPACALVPTSADASRDARVGLLLDDEEGIMAAHAPLCAAAFAEGLAAAAGAAAPPAAAGALATHGAALSANERPERILAAASLLRESGLAGRCVPLRGRPATDEELRRVHSGAHAEALRAISRGGGGGGTAAAAGAPPPPPAALVAAMRACNYVFLNEHSADAARFSAGAVVEAAAAVARGAVASAVCVVRPPGHHAEPERMMGFCVANNVAVAAAAALAGGHAARVLIVDWDIHAGNGTAAAFAADPRVLVASLHARDAYPWPARPAEAHSARAVGEGAGRGFTVNVAWGPGDVGHLVGDAEYAHAFDALLLPIARAFDPQLVLVSAGFDSAAGDEMGYGLTPAGYAALTRRLMGLAGGRLVVALEGGYNVVAVARGLHACTAALLGAAAEPAADAAAGPARPPSDVAVRCVREAADALREFWPSVPQ